MASAAFTRAASAAAATISNASNRTRWSFLEVRVVSIWTTPSEVRVIATDVHGRSGRSCGVRCYPRPMVKRVLPAVSVEDATHEVTELWAAYRAARAASGTQVEFEVLRAKVRSARARAKKRSEEPGFSTLAQQLTDLGEYIKRFMPRDGSPPVDPVALGAEVVLIEKDLRAAVTPKAKRAVVARVARVLERIEAARALDPDGDPDHDAYVHIEEHLGLLGFSTAE
jgi:hypothetical protein